MYKAQLIFISEDGYWGILGVAHSLFRFGTPLNSIKKRDIRYVCACTVNIYSPPPHQHTHTL